MSLGYKSKSIVGGPLEEKVLDQLSARKAVIKKRNDRSTEDLLFLNSTTGWVKMTSAVDVSTETDIKGNPVYSNDTSKKNVLLGGTLNSGSIQGGIFNDTDNAYKKSDMLGYRPMAGITGFKVDSKNTFGTLRVATVDFKANSIEQLDDLEQLFLRPGFSVLLEWGHSLYLDNKGTLGKTIKTFPDFFTGKSAKKIYEEIESLQKGSNYNYDAMYGFIKNFAWSYNLDGGYDCKVDLVSRGELIESLEILVPPSTSTNQNYKKSDDSTSYNPTSWTTALHLFLNTIKEVPAKSFFNDPTANADLKSVEKEFNDKVIEALNDKTPILWNELSSILFVDARELNIKQVSIKNQEGSPENESSEKYIQFGPFLELINSVFLISSDKKDENENDKIVKFKTDNYLTPTPFFTFPQHFALDPFICIIPKFGKPAGANYVGYNIAHQTPPDPVLIDQPTDTIGGEQEILNIYLNINYILDCFQITSVSSEKTVLNFVQTILRGVNENLGYINDLDIHFAEEESNYYIVDRKITPSKEDLVDSNIDLVGLNSMLENLSFTSKVSANISSMIAIGAQASSTNAGLDILNIQTWGSGLQDRHLKTKFIGSKPEEETKELETPIADIKGFLDWVKTVNSAQDEHTCNITRSDIASKIPVHKFLMTKASQIETKFEETNPGGLIPFELSFSMAGISGIKIGQAFTVPDSIMPKRYRGTIAFLVTHIDHSIKNNRWVTGIQTQMIVSKKFEKNSNDESLEVAFENILKPITS